jgi:hypothetical protein
MGSGEGTRAVCDAVLVNVLPVIGGLPEGSLVGVADVAREEDQRVEDPGSRHRLGLKVNAKEGVSTVKLARTHFNRDRKPGLD